MCLGPPHFYSPDISGSPCSLILWGSQNARLSDSLV
jgi:hypothetical protein